MTMNPVPRPNQSSEEAIQEFLDNGGKIQTFAYGQRSENIPFTGGFYGKRKKQEQPVVDTDEDESE
jgi:hypothetical protein